MFFYAPKCSFILFCALSTSWLVGCGDDDTGGSAAGSAGSSGAGQSGTAGGGPAGGTGGGGPAGGAGGAGGGGAGGAGGGGAGGGAGSAGSGNSAGSAGSSGEAGAGGDAGGGQGGSSGLFDSTFGEGGFRLLDQLPSTASLWQLALGPEGRINVVALDGPLARLRADGSPDQDFGIGGVVPNINSFFYARSVAALANGQLVVGGRSFSAAPGPSIALLNPDGTLAPAFGVGGVATIALGNVYGNVNALSVQSGGIVAGGAFDDSSLLRSSIVARWSFGGALDAGFHPPDGYHIQNGSTPADQVDSSTEAMFVGAGGAIYTCGTGGNVDVPLGERDNDVVLLRYTPGGVLDPAFGQKGVAYVDRRVQYNGFDLREDFCRHIVGLPDGKFVVLAENAAGSPLDVSDALVLRFLPDGQADPTFGDNGVVSIRRKYWNVLSSLVVLPDGALLAAGFTGSFDNAKPMLVRLSPDGTPDPNFGDAGVVVLDRQSRNFAPTLLQPLPDGKILAAGSAPKPYVARLNPL